MPPLDEILRHERIVTADGVRLHLVRAGDGPLVVLLHGFPEFWYSWRHQIPALVEGGFSVAAPDLRGYNLSDRPASVGAYHLRHLVDDVAAVIRASGQQRAHVVGHDWGGIVAWTFAGVHPELVDKLVILNAPHMRTYLAAVRRSVRQALRSWYVLLFRVPGLAEWALSAGDYAAIRRMFQRFPARRAAFAREDVERYVEAIRRPGALTAALNYYRANGGGDGIRLARSARTDAETLVIWGEDDPALGLETLEGLDRVAPRVRVHRLPGVSHWVQSEAPEAVNRALLAFLHDGAAPG
jgi:pimeloyl-ACP methyl ester carboxylesterase